MAGGADEGAGSAGAADFGKLPEGSGHLALGAPAHEADGPDVLQFMADPDALAAEDAVAVALGKAGLRDPQLLGHLPEFGNLGTAGPQEVDNQTAAFQDLFGVGEDLEALGHRVGAGGGEQGAVARGHFHQAEATAAVRLDGLVIAQGGDIDPQLAGRFQNGGPFRDLHRSVVNGQVNHGLLTPR